MPGRKSEEINLWLVIGILFGRERVVQVFSKLSLFLPVLYLTSWLHDCLAALLINCNPKSIPRCFIPKLREGASQNEQRANTLSQTSSLALFMCWL